MIKVIVSSVLDDKLSYQEVQDRFGVNKVLVGKLVRGIKNNSDDL